MPYLKDTDAAYLAGILDSDGHIGLIRRARTWKKCPERTHYLRPIVQIGQAKMIMLDHIKEVTGEGSLSINKQKHFYNLRFYTTSLKWILPQLLPYLVVKKRQAEIVVEFIERCKYQGKELTDEEMAKREALAAEIRYLNMKPKTLRRMAEENPALAKVVNINKAIDKSQVT